MKTLFFETCPMFSSMLITITIFITTTRHKYKNTLLIFMVLFILICAYGHRIPDNVNIPHDKKIITSPSYGKVKNIKEIDNYTIISISTHLEDIPVQYVPTDGTIVQKLDNYDKNLNDTKDTYLKPSYNENSVIIVSQISGMATKTIVHFKGEGDKLNKGDMLGLVRFGSKVEIYIPTSDIETILVNTNDVTKGPETALVKIK